MAIVFDTPMRPRGNDIQTGHKVQTRRAELNAKLEEYRLINDCIEGERQVKYRKTLHLPKPNPDDNSVENTARYNAYLTRAVFYNATRRTLQGLLGEIYAVDPVIEAPQSIMDTTVVDATGGGVSLIQQSIFGAQNVLGYSRAGIFVDFPDTPENGISKADVASGEYVPQIKIYEPWRVINWRTIRRGSKIVLALVVLEEDNEVFDGEFSVKVEKQYRVLRLVDDVYRVQIWRGRGVMAIEETYTPLDSSGKPFNEIPFHFIGSKNNDHLIDEPLLYDLASLNLAHYRNSADYEESSFLVGQPTFWFAGLTKDWVRDVLGGRVETGSRAAIALPERATAGILQPDPNNLPKEGMQHKERLMVALGAKIVEQRQVQRTATEASQDVRTENSILSTAANNVSDAFTWGLKTACKFTGDDPTSIKFRLNTEFAIHRMPPEEQQRLIEAWQAGLVSFEEARIPLRNSGIVSLSDADARTQIDKEREAQIERDIRVKQATAPQQPGNDNPANQE